MLCMQAAKDLSRLHIYTSMPVPLCLDTGMSASTKVKCAGSFYMFSVLQNLCSLIDNMHSIEKMYFILMVMFQEAPYNYNHNLKLCSTRTFLQTPL